MPVAFVFEVEAQGAHGAGVGHGPAQLLGRHAGTQGIFDSGQNWLEVVAEHDLCKFGHVEGGVVFLVFRPYFVQSREDTL